MNKLVLLDEIDKMYVDSYSGDDDMLCGSVSMISSNKRNSQYSYAIRIHRKYESEFNTSLHQVKTDLGWTVLHTRYLHYLLRENEI